MRTRGATTTLQAALTAAERQALRTIPRDRVVSLTERRLVEARDRAAAGGAGLPADGRPLPSVTQYDELLAHPSAAGTQGA